MDITQAANWITSKAVIDGFLLGYGVSVSVDSGGNWHVKTTDTTADKITDIAPDAYRLALECVADKLITQEPPPPVLPIPEPAPTPNPAPSTRFTGSGIVTYGKRNLRIGFSGRRMAYLFTPSTSGTLDSIWFEFKHRANSNYSAGDGGTYIVSLHRTENGKPFGEALARNRINTPYAATFQKLPLAAKLEGSVQYAVVWENIHSDPQNNCVSLNMLNAPDYPVADMAALKPYRALSVENGGDWNERDTVPIFGYRMDGTWYGLPFEDSLRSSGVFTIDSGETVQVFTPPNSHTVSRLHVWAGGRGAIRAALNDTDLGLSNTADHDNYRLCEWSFDPLELKQGDAYTLTLTSATGHKTYPVITSRETWAQGVTGLGLLTPATRDRAALQFWLD